MPDGNPREEAHIFTSGSGIVKYSMRLTKVGAESKFDDLREYMGQ